MTDLFPRSYTLHITTLAPRGKGHPSATRYLFSTAKSLIRRFVCRKKASMIYPRGFLLLCVAAFLGSSEAWFFRPGPWVPLPNIPVPQPPPPPPRPPPPPPGAQIPASELSLGMQKCPAGLGPANPVFTSQGIFIGCGTSSSCVAGQSSNVNCPP